MNFRSFFFGNYFYGICAVALAMEASLQQSYPLNAFYFYVGVFCFTVWFYTLAYVSDSRKSSSNKRTRWYQQNAQLVRYSQQGMLCLLAIVGFYFIIKYGNLISKISWQDWFWILLFPLVGMLYYGINYAPIGNINLRKVGWLKPFLIGFSWAGIANVYPIIHHHIVSGTPFSVQLLNILLFFKNFMFVSVLCIMFDIKDYAMDANHQIKTFVVNNGLRKTIFYILLPLCFAGLGSFVAWGISQHFSIGKILLNIVPLCCLIVVAYSMHRRKTILYYLMMIDGLMLLKAICGSIAMIYF